MSGSSASWEVQVRWGELAVCVNSTLFALRLITDLLISLPFPDELIYNYQELLVIPVLCFVSAVLEKARCLCTGVLIKYVTTWCLCFILGVCTLVILCKCGNRCEDDWQWKKFWQIMCTLWFPPTYTLLQVVTVRKKYTLNNWVMDKTMNGRNVMILSLTYSIY